MHHYTDLIFLGNQRAVAKWQALLGGFKNSCSNAGGQGLKSMLVGACLLQHKRLTCIGAIAGGQRALRPTAQGLSALFPI